MSFDVYRARSDILSDDYVTADAAARLTGYNIQYIRRRNIVNKLNRC